ncbi:MAG: DUF5054 domain-containing protein, partial [Victivallales bacterium]|nr:DUF5054 domain-containing protein [Victivallales bacterium]
MDFIESCVEDAGITRVLLLCKSHLDIGFTDYSSVVRSQYLEQYIPRIIRMSHQAEEGGKENIVWCSGSYIAYEYWCSVKGSALQDFEEALRKGVIGYHALPFTSHSELYDASLFASLLKDCRELDEVSGRRTRAAKMTDVPGHCCGIVPVLAAGGVEFLHLGINPASYVPEIPQFFRWRVQGHELTVMFAGTDYSADATLPDGRTRLVFMHGGDNSAPPSFGLIRQYFRELRLRYPNAVVSMGSLEDLADLVLPYRESFPVIESEIGDSWIHGLATDCVKTSRFRELLRFRRSHDGKELPREFDRQLAMTGEHTWGMDIKTHLSDDEIWMRQDFDAARRTQANFVTVEKSWEEQRA